MIIKGQIGNGGVAEGRAVVIDDSITWWGGVDVNTGRISEFWIKSKGTMIGGKVLIFPSTKGSSGNWSMLIRSSQLGTHPKAILMERGDPLIVAAAFNIGIPYLFGFEKAIFSIIKNEDQVKVDGNKGEIHLQ